MKFTITLDLDDIHKIEKIMNRQKVELMKMRYQSKHSDYPDRFAYKTFSSEISEINRLINELYQFTRNYKKNKIDENKGENKDVC